MCVRVGTGAAPRSQPALAGSPQCVRAAARRGAPRTLWVGGGRGLKLTRAPYVMMLDADDMIEPTFLEKMVRAGGRAVGLSVLRGVGPTIALPRAVRVSPNRCRQCSRGQVWALERHPQLSIVSPWMAAFGHESFYSRSGALWADVHTRTHTHVRT